MHGFLSQQQLGHTCVLANSNCRMCVVCVKLLHIRSLIFVEKRAITYPRVKFQKYLGGFAEKSEFLSFSSTLKNKN